MKIKLEQEEKFNAESNEMITQYWVWVGGDPVKKYYDKDKAIEAYNSIKKHLEGKEKLCTILFEDETVPVGEAK